MSEINENSGLTESEVSAQPTTIVKVETENSNKVNGWKIAIYIVAIVGLFFGGFLLGRKTIKPISVPEPYYIKGDTVKVEIEKPIPVEVILPIDTVDIIKDCIARGIYYDLFPQRIKDTIIYVTREDTSMVIRDWATERIYSETVFDSDTVGTVKVKAKTQYNRLTWLGTEFTPMTKVVTEVQGVKKFSPFIGGGFSTTPTIDAMGGMFFVETYGFALRYSYDFSAKNGAIGGYFLYKF